MQNYGRLTLKFRFPLALDELFTYINIYESVKTLTKEVYEKHSKVILNEKNEHKEQ